MADDKKSTPKPKPNPIDEMYDSVLLEVAQQKVGFFKGIQKIPPRILLLGILLEILLLVANVWAISRNGSVIWWQVTVPIVLISIISVLAQLVKHTKNKYKQYFETTGVHDFQDVANSARDSQRKFLAFVLTGHLMLIGMTLYSVDYDAKRYSGISNAYNRITARIDLEYNSENPNLQNIKKYQQASYMLVNNSKEIDPSLTFSPSQIGELQSTLNFFLVLTFVIQGMSVFLDLGFGDYLAVQISQSEVAQITHRVQKQLNMTNAELEQIKKKKKEGEQKKKEEDKAKDKPKDDKEDKDKAKKEAWDKSFKKYNAYVKEKNDNPSDDNTPLSLVFGSYKDLLEHGFTIKDSDKYKKPSILLGFCKKYKEESVDKHFGTELIIWYDKFSEDYKKVRQLAGVGEFRMSPFKPLPSLEDDKYKDDASVKKLRTRLVAAVAKFNQIAK